MPKARKTSSRTSKKAAAKPGKRKRAGTRSASSMNGRASRTAKRRSAGRKSAGKKTASRTRGVRAARGHRASGGTVSSSVKYSKWIDSPDDHEERPGQSLAARNHEVIRQWAEARQAVPTTVESTQREGRAGVLRLDFPGYGGNELGELTWDEWFETFEDRNLVFIYQEHKTDGSQSNFFRLSNAE